MATARFPSTSSRCRLSQGWNAAKCELLAIHCKRSSFLTVPAWLQVWWENEQIALSVIPECLAGVASVVAAAEEESLEVQQLTHATTALLPQPYNIIGHHTIHVNNEANELTYQFTLIFDSQPKTKS